MNKKLRIFYWTLFDFANTSFSITIVTFVYAVYFKQVVAEHKSIGDLYWSLATGISMLIVALISPVLGAISDYSNSKKRFLFYFTLLCVISTSMLYFTGQGMIFYGMLLFIFANIGFEAGLVFYDSFLPEITEEKNFGRVSGYGYAMGYLGSFVSLVIINLLLEMNNVRLSFPVTALFFFVFSLPLFLFIREGKKSVDKKDSYINIGISRVINTVTHLKNYNNLSRFLLAFFFYIEGVNTAIYFSGIYAASTFGFSIKELTIFFLFTQTTAVLGSIIFGIISDKIGHKPTIYITLYIWLFVIIGAFLIESKDLFYLIGILAGLGMGSTQSVSRSLISKLVPLNKKTEFFGFYSFFGKSSAIVGPLLFGLVSWISNSQRYAILSVLIFFITGMLLLRKVKENSAQSTTLQL